MLSTYFPDFKIRIASGAIRTSPSLVAMNFRTSWQKCITKHSGCELLFLLHPKQ